MANHEHRDVIVRFHERFPGVSGKYMSRLRAPDTRTSYEMLADAVLNAGSPATLLDIGCGDGEFLELVHRRDPAVELFGVDFVSSEAQAARARVPGALITVDDVARALPYADASFDAVSSHLVMMLLGQLDAFVSSVSRVLRPRGRFAFIVDALHLQANSYVGALREAMQAAGVGGPDTRFDRAADARLYDAAQLAALLASHDLHLKLHEHHLVASSDDDVAVGLVVDSYPLGLLGEDQREAARAAVRGWFRRNGGPIQVPLQLIVAERGA